MQRFILALLIGCEPSKSSPDPITFGDDIATPTDPIAAPDPILPMLTSVGSYGVGDLDTLYAGYSAHAGSAGLLWTDTATGIIWRCPYEGIGEIDEVCEPALSGQEWSIDRMQLSGRALAVADALDYGIAYEVPDTASGALADVAIISVSGGYAGGYTGIVLWLDADGDGDADDLVATSGTHGDLGWSEEPEDGYYGEMAVFHNASGSLAWDDADLYLPACADGGRLQWGPVAIATDGTALAAACPGYTYREGAVEGWSLPLTERAADWSVEASGFFVAAQPSGFVADYRGYGLVWIQPDGDHIIREAPIDGELPGTAPDVLTTSTGRVLLVTGSQARTSSGVVPLAPLRRLDPGEGRWRDEYPWQALDGDDPYYGGVAVCDISDGWDADMCAVADLPSDGYATCTGAVQGLVEVDGQVYAMSSGWVFGSGEGCGLTGWLVE